LQLVRNETGEVGFEVLVGGGLGRTPIIGEVVREFLPKRHLLSYLEAILRIYNLQGRRDHLFKSRIKILVKALGIEEFRARVEREWEHLRDDPALTLEDADIERMQGYFTRPDYRDDAADPETLARRCEENPHFARWLQRN